MRGGDPIPHRAAGGQGLFPACAGVILQAVGAADGADTFPRMRGGDPVPGSDLGHTIDFSPHARG